MNILSCSSSAHELRSKLAISQRNVREYIGEKVYHLRHLNVDFSCISGVHIYKGSRGSEKRQNIVCYRCLLQGKLSIPAESTSPNYANRMTASTLYSVSETCLYLINL